MTAQLQVPGGDPAALRSVAGQLGRLASDQATQLAAFKGHVRGALAGWTGLFAEQYAVAAGHACGRFTAVSSQLKSAQAALGTYAGALENAQQTVAQANRDLAAHAGTTSSPAYHRGAAALTELARASNTCARALSDVQSALAVACPDTLTGQQLVALVERAGARIGKQLTIANFERLLAGWTLYADAVHGIRGYQAGAEAVRESEAIAKALSAEKLPAQAMKLLEHVKNPDPLIEAWQKMTADALGSGDGASAGGGLWRGLLEANQIDVEAAGAHAAEQTFIDEFLRAGRFAQFAVPLAIVFGLHDIIWPGDGPTWEQWGNRVAGAASVYGGALALAEIGATIGATTWEIPVVDLVTESVAATLLTASALWSLGDFVYSERHNIAAWFDESRHFVAHVADDIWYAPDHFAHAMQSWFNPLDW